MHVVSNREAIEFGVRTSLCACVFDQKIRVQRTTLVRVSHKSDTVFFIHSLIGFENMVRMLIDKGADVNTIDDKNNSALLYAAKNGNILIKFHQSLSLCLNNIEHFFTI